MNAFIPFSMSESSTSFRDFVLENKSSVEPASSGPQPRHIAKFDALPAIPRLYLSNKIGYVTIHWFECILQFFTKWCNDWFLGIQCYVICDQLPVCMNNSIKAFAMVRCTSIIPIKPGSSHWFQVHD